MLPLVLFFRFDRERKIFFPDQQPGRAARAAAEGGRVWPSSGRAVAAWGGCGRAWAVLRSPNGTWTAGCGGWKAREPPGLAVRAAAGSSGWRRVAAGRKFFFFEFSIQKIKFTNSYA